MIRASAVGKKFWRRNKCPPQTSEHALQVAIAEYLGWVLAPPVWWTGIDHAAKVSLRYGAMRKRRGVKRGIADFLIIAPGPNVLWIEVKRGDGKLQPEQKDFATAMHGVKAWCVLCRSVEEVAKALDYIRIPRGNTTGTRIEIRSAA